MAQPSNSTPATSSLIQWKTDKVTKLVGKTPQLGPDGLQMKGGKNGKTLLFDRKKEEVSLDYPSINLQAITDPSDLSFVVEEILQAQKPGFTTMAQVLGHIAYGLHASPRVMLNKGDDIRLSASQINALKMMVNCFNQGLMPDVEQIVEILERQGIPDARREFQLRLAVDSASEEEEEATS